MNPIRILAIGIFVFLSGQTLAAGPNVLLILVDDLKPALGCYGDPIAKTPNLDGLAARGLRFELACCNQAVCAPSRFTLLLGSHSTSTGLYGLGSQLRQIVPDAITLPQHFAQYGYRTESLGKVFHIGHGNQGDPASFQVPHFHDKVIEYVDPDSTDGGQLTREEAYFGNQQLGRIGELPRGAAFESPDVADVAYADGRVALETMGRLQAARQRRERDGTPFFIVAGFARPHLPFSAPRKYWDLYDPAQLPLPGIDAPPIDAPAVAGKKNGELANYKPVPNDGVVDSQLTRQLIHGYYASVSFVDAQIGKVLDELARLQLDDNTIVVLWGDHGFHLGDHGLWTKHTNYEQATRIPLIVVAPGVTQPGTSTRQLAESVDVFPTLTELAGLPPPRGPQPIDGVSLVPVLRNPTTRVRDHAYHVYPKAKLGRAIRSERYRLVEWRQAGAAVEASQLELYDYESDPQESRNLAAEQPQIVARLRATLASYPPPIDPGSKPAKAAKPPGTPTPGDASAVGNGPPRTELLAGIAAHDRALYIKSGWMRDPYIVLAPDGYYYLTGTTPNPDDPRQAIDPYNTGLGDQSIVGYHMQLWRSTDLAEWQYLGSPFTLLDGYWAKREPQKFTGDRTHWHLWAPECHFLNGKWHIVHTTPGPVKRGSNLAVTFGHELQGPYSFPLGELSGGRHDPSLFRDDDGTVYLLWQNTLFAPLSSDLTRFIADPVRIDPAGSRPGPDGQPISRIGHEGATLRKIGGKYVHFGTAWSTDQGRKGSYNLYYYVAKKITGPYGPRKFAGRFLGHGTPFKDKAGKWWCTAFFNGNVPPLPRAGIEARDLREDAQTINPQGLTIVPLEVRALDDGDIQIRAKDPAYATPGPDEAQQFDFD